MEVNEQAGRIHVTKIKKDIKIYKNIKKGVKLVNKQKTENINEINIGLVALATGLVISLVQWFKKWAGGSATRVEFNGTLQRCYLTAAN